MTKTDEKILALLDDVDHESANLRRAIGFNSGSSLMALGQAVRLLSASQKIEKELSK